MSKNLNFLKKIFLVEYKKSALLCGKNQISKKSNHFSFFYIFFLFFHAIFFLISNFQSFLKPEKCLVNYHLLNEIITFHVTYSTLSWLLYFWSYVVKSSRTLRFFVIFCRIYVELYKEILKNIKVAISRKLDHLERNGDLF